jgi:energy-coupling factor transporter ATP-binding protein EcfA2
MMIGREMIVSEVSDKLREERFVTLLGPGGIGKTTIALAVGRAVAEEFGGKVHFVDLERKAPERADLDESERPHPGVQVARGLFRSRNKLAVID